MHLSFADIDVKNPPCSLKNYFSSTWIVSFLEALYCARYTDEKMAKLVRQNKGGAFHLSAQGHELIGTVCGKLLTPGKDWAFPYYRDRALALALGTCLSEIFGAFFAKNTPHHSSGRMMPDHFSHPKLRMPVQSSVVGSQLLQAVGVAKAIKLEGKNELVYVSAGEGATSQGDFHEALNYSCIHALPIVFVIQDNGWAISVPAEQQTAGRCISKIVSGYPGLDTHLFDGTCYTQTVLACRQAFDKARNNEGPSILIAKIPRIGAHSSSDDPKKYKTEEQIADDHAKDPITIFSNWALDNAFITPDLLENVQNKVRNRVEQAAVRGESYPDPCPSNVSKHLFASYSPVCVGSKVLTEDSFVMVDALNQALQEEMTLDPTVLVFGQDVAGGKAGVFGVTRSLTEKFGENRCFNTPLAESTIVGMAIGLGLKKFCPVVEIQFCDYMWTAMNQIVNELSSLHYRSNGAFFAPVTIRMPYGAYIQGGPYHSQRNEAFFAHCPGLKVVIPSNAFDAKALLKTAIRDPNPVIFLEHKALYRQRAFAARPLGASTHYLSFGKANIVQKGSDITIISYGMMAMFASDIALQLKKEGISCEVVDLRTIVPLDEETISQSVRKTGKVCILQEAYLFAGIGAEIAAQISSRDFCYLDAPILRIGAKAAPIPYAKNLEQAVLPEKKDIIEKIRLLHSY